jgi:iron complex outermembrane receptor protein
MKKTYLLCAVMGAMTAMANNGRDAEAKSADAAKEQVTKTGPVDSLKTVELQAVQVSSTRASKKTPMAFTDMNRDDIKQVNHGQDIPYLLSLTPSVTVTSDAGNGIGYTTIRVRGTAPERINITANGIPMNDAESNQLYWVNMGDFASSVQTMQIQRGVGTSTNGAGAFGATINMQTENIGTKPFVGLDASGGSYGTHKETVRFGTGLLSEHWGLQGRLSNISSDGYIDRASTRLNSYFLQAGYFGENTAVKFITFNAVEKTYHAWDFSSKYEQSRYGRTYNPCGAMEWNENYDPIAFYDNQTDNYHQQNYQLIWTQRFSRMLNLNAALHYTNGKGYYEQFKDGAKLKNYISLTDDEQGMRSDLVRQKKMANNFYGAVASLNFDNRSGLEASLGGGWNKYDGDHFGLIKWMKAAPSALKPDYEYYRDNAKKTDFNVYGKVSYSFVEGLNAYVDLQYRHIGYKMQAPIDQFVANKSSDYVIDDKFNFFNPKFGLNYQLSPNHRIYASYAIAHKEPTRNDYQNNFGLNLKSERLNDLEVGYNFRSTRFTAGLNLYWMNYKDQFVLTGALNEIGEAVAMNVPKSYRLGAEVEAAWRPADWFRWDLNATLSKNRVKDAVVALHEYDKTSGNFVNAGTASVGDAPLSFSPDLILNNILTFSYWGFKGSVQSQYIGKQYLTNSGFKTMVGYDENGNATEESLLIGGRFTTNVDLSYNFGLPRCGLKDVTVGVMFYNVFNTKYDTNGWASPKYHTVNGQTVAYNGSCLADGAVRDQWAVGFAPAAPFNFMAHLSVNF